MSKFLRRLTGWHFERKLPRGIYQIISELKDGDICIDVGANVGVVSEIFLSRGAQVYAFEPHPIAFSKLKQLKKNYLHFTPYNKIVAKSDGVIKLYLHKEHEKNPIKFSTGSSLIATKPNVSQESIECEAIDFVRFLGSLKKITIIKIDVEGYEVELIPELIRVNALVNVEHVFVETHDSKWADLKERTEYMKTIVSGSPHAKKFRWDWP